jgi:antitoxin component YwqK of YwqJK toxin-antitoxin module/Tfp pilus assembly protein PilF
MKAVFRITVVLCIGILSFPLFSQESNEGLVDSDQLMERAKQQHDSGNYDKAIHLLERVSMCDPAYPRACYETALSLYFSDSIERALSKCREAENLHFDEPVLSGLEGSILDDLGRTTEGIAILEKAIKKWPYNQNLLYNLGVCYLNAGYPEKAEQVLCQSILCNPYHMRSNLALAKANYSMGRLGEAHLAFNMAILLNPSLNNIREYENAISGKTDLVQRGYLYPYPAGYDRNRWETLRSLIVSEFAFKDEAGYPYALNYTITREAFLLFSNLSADERDTTIYNRLYGGLFSYILTSGNLETYLYYAMGNTADDEVRKWSAANSGKIKAFISVVREYLNQGRKYGFSSALRASGNSYYHFDDDGTLNAIGLVSDADTVKNGKWSRINSDGGIDESGVYVHNNAQGEYLLYWPGGNVKQRLFFDQGMMNGTCYTYHPDSSPEGIYPMRDGLKNGVVTSFTPSGLQESVYTYRNDTIHGKGSVTFFTNGFRRDFTYASGQLNGTETETWLNGVQKLKTNLTNGDLDGEHTTWFANGQEENRFQYTSGVKTGKYVTYHFNGKRNEEGEFNKEGGLTGTYLAYDNQGKPKVRQAFFDNGLLDGVFISYFPDGQKQIVRTYRHDTLAVIESFDGKGNLLHKSELKDHILSYKSYYYDGTIYADGMFRDGLQHGTWKYFDPLGILTQERYYKDNLLYGPQKSYYSSGRLKEEYSCDSSNIIGRYVEYFINGKVKTTGNYVKEGKSGEWLVYYSNDSVETRSFFTKGTTSGRTVNYAPNGMRISEEFFNSGGNSVRYREYDQNGIIWKDLDYLYGELNKTIRFPNGELREVNHIKDNVRDSIQETYYPNGQIATRYNSIHGKNDGTYTMWDVNGDLTAELHYVMGQADGTWKWYENGKLDYESHYENGLKQGKSVSYYENGKVARESEYDQDQRNGITDYYAMDGTFMYRLRFVEGSLKGFSWKDQAGRFVAEHPVTPATTEVLCYYPNGKVSVRFSIKNGLFHGMYRSFYNSGRIMRESRFEDDRIEGIDRIYLPGGKLYEETTFLGDERYGSYSLYNENGIRRLEGQYLDNNRHGIWHVNDNTGKPVHTLVYNYGTLYEIRSK